MKSNKVLGIDIGGSHIIAAVIDHHKKMILKESIHRRVINSHGTADEILAGWTETIRNARNSCAERIEHIGFAMPGPFDYAKGICLIKGFDKYEALYKLDIKEIMSSMLDILPDNIVFRNDATCFLDGEMMAGAAVGYKHAIGITLGTGLGSATSTNGVTRDAELSVLRYKGEIIEEFVSTRGLIRTYKELAGITVSNVKDLAELHPHDEKARQAFDIFSEQLAWFLCQFVKKEQEVPEVLVIGGNIALCWHLFMPQVVQQMEKASVHLPKIVPAANGEHAALMGAISPFVEVANNKMSFAY